MYAAINGIGNGKSVYVMQSYRKEDGKTSSRVFRKLGRLDELLKKFDGDQVKMLEWAKKEAAKDTEKYSVNKEIVSVTLSANTAIPKDEERCFSAGYLFLQKICTDLRFQNICRNIGRRYKYDYNLEAILTDLIYARILSPASKLSSYSFCKTLLEPPKYSLQNMYRALSVLAKESAYIQEELYRNSNFVHSRNTKVLYYDCTNYYFEIEQEEGIKKYGKSKEHRPNPIVTMGLFMDTDGIPLAFDINQGNQNEQTTLKPLETQIIRDFGCSEFIFCSDAGLGGKKNRFLNSFGNRSYVITHSIKKMKKEDQEVALSKKQYRKLGSDKFIDIGTIDEKDEKVFNTVFYKEIPVKTGNMEETVIVTYSPKYKAYQKKIREGQIERAQQIISGGEKKRKSKNQNDPQRFVKQTKVTESGEVAEKTIYELDLELIKEEEKFDGYYAVITNIEDDVEQILKINSNRWEIEENFRILKTEFEARPVYVSREDRIKAHFLTCYASLLVYRLLEKKLENKYTCEELLTTLRNLKLTLLSKSSGYVPSYKRTQLTDDLHEKFGFRTDNEFTSKVSMRSIIKKQKNGPNR